MSKITYIFLVIFLILYSCKNTKETIKESKSAQLPTSVDSDSCYIDYDSDGIPDYIDEDPVVYGSGKPDKMVVYTSGKSLREAKSISNIISISRESTSTSLIDLEKELARILQLESGDEKGIVAYSFPSDEMKVGYKYKITLRITKENNIEAAKVLVIGDRNIPIVDRSIDSKVNIENIRVEQKMSAYLISDSTSFLITKMNSELQEIENTGYTEWSWVASPLKGGKSYLKMIIKIRIKSDGEVTYKDIIVFDKNIQVKSNVSYSIKYWFTKYWQWLFTTVIIPFIVWFYKRRKKED